MGGVDLVDQQLDSLHVLRKSYKWYRKIFMRLVMQCALAAHKLYKKEGGKEEFIYFLLDICTQLLQNAPRLQGQRCPPADNIIRLTGRNHWPAKRGSPESGKECSQEPNGVEYALQRGKKQQEEAISRHLGYAKAALVNQDFVFQNVLRNTTPNFIIANN